MSKGGKPGRVKTGGRTAGTPNARTILKIEEAAGQITAIRKSGHKKATEVLNDLMQTSVTLAERYHKRIIAKGNREASEHDWERFWKAMECAGTFGKALAPFQDPTFKAIAVFQPPALPHDLPTVTKDGNVLTIDDPVAMQRLYQRMIKGVK
jgi:hypothetical protein